MASKIRTLISNSKFIGLLLLAVIVISSVQSYSSKGQTFGNDTRNYTKYNNYKIFQASTGHFFERENMYAAYPEEHFDIYKYTPTFAVAFGAIGVFPDLIGLHIWNILNVFILVFAIYYLPRLSKFNKGLILLISLTQLITSIQNEQSNGLIVGLIILAFGLMERKKLFLAALCICIAIFVKPFGIVAFALFLLYPNRIKSILYSLICMISLFLLPILFVGLADYQIMISQFLEMLSADHSESLGLSVMGFLEAWFGIGSYKMIILSVGVVIFLIPFAFIKNYTSYNFRLMQLCSVLMWIIMFNHKAESPTYIIATIGVAIWFVSSNKGWIDTSLFIFAFVFICLSPTDLIPKTIRFEVINPLVLQIPPLLLIWLRILYTSITSSNKENKPQLEAIS